jgi:hypothetical protein
MPAAPIAYNNMLFELNAIDDIKYAEKEVWFSFGDVAKILR